MAFNKEKSRMLLLGRNSHRNLRAPSWKATKQLSRKGSEGPGGHGVEHEPAE